MATINRVSVAVVSVTGYPELLFSGAGSLVTLPGYAEGYTALGVDRELPWMREPPHWSRFWASYLGKENRVRSLGHDAAWERVIPFRWLHDHVVTGPDGVDVGAEVLVYPSAIVVVMRLDVAGEWQLDEVSKAVAKVRDATSWSISLEDGVSENRSLDGVASELSDRAASLLAEGELSPDVTSELLVVAPTAGEGDPASFDLLKDTVKSCVAGLAVLGPPGKLVAERLLEENTDPRYGARFYVLKGGHAIWHPSTFLEQPATDPIGCLHRNQTDLVAHIAALGDIVGWAADRAKAAGIPVAVQPLVKRATERLELLHEGNPARTYRSGIAKARIEPLLGEITTVKAEL
jgi:hypothetical protein